VHWQHIWEAFWIIFALGGSIFVHEFGHYWAAKHCGLWVPCFSIGFGPKLFAWHAKGTRFQIALIPLGGYVILPQMDGMETSEDAWVSPAEAVAKKVPTFWERVGILSAGVGFNIFSAMLIACLLWVIGIPAAKSDCTTIVGAIPQTIAYVDMPNPLAMSDLRIGDRILSVDGIVLQKFSQLSQLIATGVRHTHNGQPSADLQICRGNDVFHLEIPVFHPRKDGNNLRHIVVFPAGELLVKTILEGSPAQRAGLRAGDQILAIDGNGLFSPAALDEYLQKSSAGVDLTVCRDGKILQVFINPQPIIAQKAHMRGMRGEQPIVFVEGEGSRWLALNGSREIKNRRFSSDELAANFTLLQRIPPVTKRALGVTFENPQILLHPNPFKLLLSEVRSAGHVLCSLLNRHSDVGVKHLMGIPGIGRLLHNFMRSDLRLALAFIVTLNLGIAVLNLLPIPGLDGGLIFFAIIEKIIRRKLPKWLINFSQSLCLFLIFLLLIYVCVSDILHWRYDITRHNLDALYQEPRFSD
jgi:regulator of sigma E protease